jgi:mannose-6-phosphate isomerase-like protein (cupin superfamily)
MAEVATENKMQIFRAAQAPKLMEAGVLEVKPFDATQRAGMNELVKAGYLEGDEERELFNMPGFSLIHVWFKKDYPLALHSHDSDCLYYIVAGSLRLGTEELGPRDGFFIPAGTPYKYRPGRDGVEVLEFRHTTKFDFRNLSTGAGFYTKALEAVASNLDGWRQAKMPSEH